MAVILTKGEALLVILALGRLLDDLDRKQGHPLVFGQLPEVVLLRRIAVHYPDLASHVALAVGEYPAPVKVVRQHPWMAVWYYWKKRKEQNPR